MTPSYPLETNIIGVLTPTSLGASSALIVQATIQSGSWVRAGFLRWFLLEGLPQAKLLIGRFELEGAVILGQLDLSGSEIKFTIRFINCTFLETINLCDAEMIGCHFISGSAPAVLADRLAAKGSLQIGGPITQSASLNGPFTISRQLRLCGAKIHGNLDLRRCKLTGSDVPLFADGLTVEGHLLLSNGFEANGEIRLNGSQLQRNFDCAGATLRATEGYSLSAAGAYIKGSVYLKKAWEGEINSGVKFTSVGTVRLDGSKIDGDLDLSGGEFTAAPYGPNWVEDEIEEDDWYALKADGVAIGGDLVLRGGCYVHGSLSLINARVNGDFICEGANLDFPGEEVLVADGITVLGTTFLSDESGTPTRINGILRFIQASLKQGFEVTGVQFDTTKKWNKCFDNSQILTELYGADHRRHGLCGIYAPRADLSGAFYWQNVRRADGKSRYHLWFYLFGAKADAIHDDKNSWEKLDRVDITGCAYASIATLTGNLHWRLGMLDEQYAILNDVGNRGLALRILLRRIHELDGAVKRFSPQPYLQLAKIVRQSGYERPANRILVRLERKRTWYSDFGPLRQFGRHILDLILRYGFSRFRPIWILVAWTLFSAVCFEAAYQNGKIVPIGNVPSRVSFNSLVYAIDTLVPIVDLNQKKNWVVEPLSPYARAVHVRNFNWCERIIGIFDQVPLWAGFLVFFNTFFGWAMTTFFAAGISGLLRTGREEG